MLQGDSNFSLKDLVLVFHQRIYLPDMVPKKVKDEMYVNVRGSHARHNLDEIHILL